MAERLEWSPSKVSRIERGQVAASTHDVRRMLDLYGASEDQRRALIQVATKAQEKSWWQAYGDTLVVPLVGLEEAAAAIQTYEAIVVPGLFQTANYARAILRSARPDMPLEQIDRWVELRMARRDFLFGRTNPPALAAVIDEAVLRRPVGNPEIMAQQLQRLIEAAKLQPCCSRFCHSPPECIQQ